MVSWEVIYVKCRITPFADSLSFFQMLWQSNDYLNFLFVAWNLKGAMEISFSLNIHFTVWDFFFPYPIKCSGWVCTVAITLYWKPYNLIFFTIRIKQQFWQWIFFCDLTTQEYYLCSATKSLPVTFFCGGVSNSSPPPPSQTDGLLDETQYLEVFCSLFHFTLFAK